MRLPATILFLLLTLVPGTSRADWHHREAAIMGTRIAVELWSDDDAVGERAVEAVLGEMRRVDALMSHYKPESQLSQINQRADREAVRVDTEFAQLIVRAARLSELTGGAFDITYASVGYLYDYRAHTRPTDAEIAAGFATTAGPAGCVDPGSGLPFRPPPTSRRGAPDEDFAR